MLFEFGYIILFCLFDFLLLTSNLSRRVVNASLFVSCLVSLALFKVDIALLLRNLMVDFHLVRGGAKILILAELALQVAEHSLRKDLDVSDLDGLEPDAPALGQRLQRFHNQFPDGVTILDNFVD